jgi:adenosylhomocysteine nucleosidase
MTPVFQAGDLTGTLAVDACVLTAMDDEAAPFLERATSVSDVVRYGNADHRVAVVEGRRILLIRCGIGLVNAAGAATEAILRTRSSSGTAPLVISAGSAGGVGADVSVGEVVAGSRYLNADADVRVFDYALGQSPGMPPFYAPPASVLGALPSDPRDAAGVPIRVRQGLILSGDRFVSGDLVAGIRESFPDVLATDMESVGIAQVCRVYDVPFVSIRGVSDLADPSAVGDHLTHVDDASDRSARVVLALLAAL